MGAAHGSRRKAQDVEDLLFDFDLWAIVGDERLKRRVVPTVDTASPASTPGRVRVGPWRRLDVGPFQIKVRQMGLHSHFYRLHKQ